MTVKNTTKHPEADTLQDAIVPLVMPDDGIGPVLDLIRSAQEILLIKQFSFDHPLLLQEVLGAHARGVLVRVMLNQKRADGRRDNDSTRQVLQDAGVSVRWTKPSYPITHEKTVVVDDQRALISTFNFTPKSFGQTRDYGVITPEIDQVADIIACFVADWRRAGFNPAPGTGLFWSRQNSRRTMIEFLDSAKKTLDVQHPKLVDTTILERLLAARERGVSIRFLCGGKSGISEYDLPDTLASLRLLQYAGIPIRKMTKPIRMHAKFILADGRQALMGSMNLCRDSFEYRREIGITLKKGAALERFRAVFEHDWAAARPWDIPDALTALEIRIEEEEPERDPGYTDD
jgi:phosphatidylserine/phosphatidylglycerophosphate/cardiolipin synthase-like enzyme